MLKLEYFGQTRAKLWLLIPWFLASPEHQQPWYWLCRIARSVSPIRKNLNHMHQCWETIKKKCKFIFYVSLTHFGLMKSYGIKRSWSTLIQIMAWCLTAPSHYLNQCWLITNVDHRNKFRWNFKQNMKLIQRNAFENVCKMPVILLKPQCVNSLALGRFEWNFN